MVKEGVGPGIQWTFPIESSDYEVARVNFRTNEEPTEGYDVAGAPLVRIRFRIKPRTHDTVGKPMLPSRNH